MCVSVPVHEELPVVFDQLDNLRAFLPDDSMIVLHVAKGFSDPAQLSSMMPDGIYVNPTSLSTEWGDVLTTHNSNFRFAQTLEPFDYFVIHASNDAYIRSGADAYVSSADAGCQVTPCQPWIEQLPSSSPISRRSGPQSSRQVSPTNSFSAFVADLGGCPALHSQPEGMFFRTELFDEIVSRIERHWDPANRDVETPEHFFYSTAAAALGAQMVPPLVYSDAHMWRARSPLTSSLVGALRAGTFVEDDSTNWRVTTSLEGRDTDDTPTPPPANDFSNVYAVKRVARHYDDVLRTKIRMLARAEAEPLLLRRPADFAQFSAYVYIEEVLDTPRLLETFSETFTRADEIGLVVMVASPLSDLPALEKAVASAGLDRDEASTVTAFVRPNTLENALYLVGCVDAVVSEHPPQGLLGEKLHVRIGAMSQLRLLAERATRLRLRPNRT